MLLSIVVPTYNEEQVIEEFHHRLTAVLQGLAMETEILYVNDGSTDRTLEMLKVLRRNHLGPWHVGIIDLSRNFGKEIAMTAGLDFANGDATVIIDSDLQDPPELISEFVKHWREGYDVVYGRRTAREGESALKRLTAYWFYRLMRRVGRVSIPADAGDFRLLSRRGVEALKQLREQHRFMKGLFAWIGYQQLAVPYHRQPRHDGRTKWNYWQLWNFALEGITSFTTPPLRVSTYVGLITALGSFMYGFWIIFQKIVLGNPVPGYPSLMMIILFLGGIQLVTIGIIGEYLGRMFDETKRRPLYLVNSYDSAGPATRDSQRSR